MRPLNLSVAPLDALLDERIGITIAGLTGGSRVHLRLRNHTLNAEAHAEFSASHDGVVDVAAHAPVGGDYDGVDAAGLFWSARFDEGSNVVTMISTLSTLAPLTYTLTASADDGPEMSVDFERRVVAANVVRTTVRDGRIRGTLFAPDGVTNAPGVIVLGGSDGGTVWAFVAAMLAAHGMAALVLAYFDHDDLPKELVEIPIEYIGEAVDWLRDRPEVGDARVGVLGMSRGGEAALLAGASLPGVAAVVALVPSGLTGGGIGADFSAMGKPAWTLNGVPFPILPPPSDPISMKAAQDAFTTGQPLAGAPGMLRSLDAVGAWIETLAIRVERTNGAIFLISAEDDQLWPSVRLTEIAEQRLAAAAFRHPFEHRRYRSAGHFAVLPPNLPATSQSGRHPVVPISLAFGGTAQGNAAASADLWPRIVAFLHQHLRA
jgi:dienelactone hydrolase